MPTANTSQGSDERFKLNQKPKSALDIELTRIVYQHLFCELYELTDKIETMKSELPTADDIQKHHIEYQKINAKVSAQTKVLWFLVSLSVIQTAFILIILMLYLS